jgi:drug/metabolite transporter (DMT)-like permease
VLRAALFFLRCTGWVRDRSTGLAFSLQLCTGKGSEVRLFLRKSRLEGGCFVSTRSKNAVAFAALGIIWGTTWVAAQTLGEYVPPLRGAAVRFLLAALLWLPVILWKRLKWPRGRALGIVLLLPVSLIALPSLLLLWAQARVPSATVAVSFSALPLLVIFLTPALAGREVPRLAMQASIAGLGAMALALGATFSVAQAGGAAVVLLAVASIGASAIIARRELGSVHPIVLTALVLGAAGLLLFLVSLALEYGQPVQWNRGVVGAVLFLAGVAGAPAYATYFWLLQRLEAYQVGTVQWIEPLVAILESALILRLGLSFNMIAGSLVALLCLFLVMRARAEDDDTVSLLGN